MTGVDLETVRELLGRKIFQMTLRYSRLSRDHKRHAINTLGRRLDSIWTPKLKKEDPSEETHRVESHQLDTLGHNAEVAQSVEHWTENPGVDGSIPSLGTLPT